MTITSFYFLALISVGCFVYYIIPKKIQWLWLLALSLVFYYFADCLAVIAYMVVMTAIAYTASMVMSKVREKEKVSRTPTALTILSIAIIVGIWFVVKGRGLWYPILEIFFKAANPEYLAKINSIQIVAALGMGYYTLQVLGYIIECYWETIELQKNPLKLFLFVAYFPQLTSGPISRYSQLKTLYEPHKFDYTCICFGAQRILWGFFKKIVLAERIGIIVTGIIGNPTDYHALYSWIAVLLYPLQMYTDFSGCMDIILGVSELFGIELAENFKNPFFSRNSQEFWQRWHITLGAWAKDYVLYPLLKSGPMITFGKFTKKKFGRFWGSFMKNCVGMFFLWMVMGIWHGAYNHIVGVSLWYWVILMLGNLLMPIFTKVTTSLHMKTESLSWHIFQSARTYVIYAIGSTFFSYGISRALSLLSDCAKTFYMGGYFNPWILFDRSILNLGIEYRDINIIFLGIFALLIVDILREKYGYAREWISQQTFVFRWLIWLSLFEIVLLWGMYGTAYKSSVFIYQGF